MIRRVISTWMCVDGKLRLGLHLFLRLQKHYQNEEDAQPTDADGRSHP